MEEYKLVAAVAISSIGTVLISKFMTYRSSKNVEILTRRNLDLFKLPHDEKRLTNIFTNLEKNARVAIAVELLKEFKTSSSQASTRLENAQEEMDDLLREVKRIQGNVNSKKTRGEKDTMFSTHLAPKLTQMKFKLFAVSLRLESCVMIDPIINFLENVVDGHGRKKIISLYELGNIRIPIDPGLTEAIKEANKTLSLGDSEFEKAMETWIADY